MSGESEKIHLSLNLSIPKLKLPRPTKKQKQIAGGILALVLISGAGLKVATYLAASPSATTAAGSGSAQKISFAPLASPSKGPVSSTHKLAYDSTKKVASFEDKVAGVGVTVSQQALPSGFKENPEQEVEKLAKGFNATKPIDARGIKAFSGTSSEDSSQTIIFTRKSLLVFIRAKKELDKDTLIQYIADLK